MKTSNANKRTSIRKLARISGLSVATISRAFNKHPYVTEATRAKVFTLAKQSGYSPVPPKWNRTVAIMDETVRSSAFAYYHPLITALTGEFLAQDIQAHFINPQNSGDIIASRVRLVIATSSNSQTVEMIEASGVPVLMVNNIVAPFASVCTDHRQGLRIAVEYLAAHGHRRIGLICPAGESWGNRERMIGYHEGLDKYGLLFDENLVTKISGGDTIEAVARLLRQAPTAVTAHGEQMALPIHHALYVLGKNIPSDISLVTFESPQISRYLTPPHTTVSQNFEALAAAAVEIVRDFLDGKALKTCETLLPCSIIERDSVRDNTEEETGCRARINL